MYQTIFLKGGKEVLTFLQADFASAYNMPGGAVVVSVVDPFGQEIFDKLYKTPAFSPFIKQTASFESTSGPGYYTFDFSSLAGGHAAIIDDVSVMPEPKTALTLPAGLGLLALRSRKRKMSPIS